jgi:BlaI family transcriptional regulator, penicillinase repressor
MVGSIVPVGPSSLVLDMNQSLSRRERQIVDVLFKLGKASAADVRAELPDAPSYSAVRALLRILEEKGHVKHEQDGPRYVYTVTVPRDSARRSALKHLVQTFFEGSTTQAISALLDSSSSKLSDADLERLGRILEEARKRGA